MIPIRKFLFAAALLWISLFQGFQGNQRFAIAALPQTEQPHEAVEVDFTKDVWPIFESRCVECHNAERAEGDLRFDAGIDEVRNGGHTGRTILGQSAKDSELIRRISSSKTGYQMPKKGPPLTSSQIALLTSWVDAGAPWVQVPSVNHDAVSQNGNQSQTDEPTGAIDAISNRVVWFQSRMHRRGFRRMVYLICGLLLTLVVLFIWMRFSSAKPNTSQTIGRLKTITIVGLIFLILATWIHYDAKYRVAEAGRQALEAKLQRYIRPPEEANSLSPPYPMHPIRLGGVYYRGNDERDPQLFNGGFYRTAQLEVWLTDADGNRLKWEDKLPDDTYIELTIKRAANTTGELFSDRVMSVVGLSDDVRLSDDAEPQTTVGDVIEMETMVADQQWRSRYRLPVFTEDTGGGKRIEGKVFLVQNTSQPKAHYGIEYEILTDAEGKILVSSQLWMGSLFNLKGRVFVPYRNNKILLDRWFDFRPIPEITGPQTNDPELLGVPEHQ